MSITITYSPELGRQIFRRILDYRKRVMKAHGLMPQFVALTRQNRKLLSCFLSGHITDRVLGFDILPADELGSEFYQTYLGCLTMRIGDMGCG